jgi:hypothetical protein
MLANRPNLSGSRTTARKELGMALAALLADAGGPVSVEHDLKMSGLGLPTERARRRRGAGKRRVRRPVGARTLHAALLLVHGIAAYSPHAQRVDSASTRNASGLAALVSAASRDSGRKSAVVRRQAR